MVERLIKQNETCPSHLTPRRVRTFRVKSWKYVSIYMGGGEEHDILVCFEVDIDMIANPTSTRNINSSAEEVDADVFCLRHGLEEFRCVCIPTGQ